MEGKWDSFIKNIGVLTIVATLAGSAVAFFIQRYDIIQQEEIQAKARERESKRVFLEKQAELYFEVVPLVSRLANAETVDQEDVRLFWQLYWGELGMVEDRSVESAMVLFGKSLNALLGKENNAECANGRQDISITLAHCIRKSLGYSWDVNLEDLNIDKCNEERFEKLDQICMQGAAESKVESK